MQQQHVGYPQDGTAATSLAPRSSQYQVVLATQPKPPRTKEEGILADYQRGKSKRFGAAVLAFGLLAIILNASNMAIQANRPHDNNPLDYYNFRNLAVIAASGIWAGIFYVIAGGLALGVYCKTSVGMVRGTMAMAIVAVILGFTDLSLAIAGLAIESNLDYPDGDKLEDADEDNSELTMFLCVMSALVAATVVGVSIAIADLGGKVLCAGPPAPEPQPGSVNIALADAMQLHGGNVPHVQGGSMGLGAMGPQTPQAMFQNDPRLHMGPANFYSNEAMQNDQNAEAHWFQQDSSPRMTAPPSYDSILAADGKPSKD